MEPRTFLTGNEIFNIPDDQLDEHEKAVREYWKGNPEPLKKWFENNKQYLDKREDD